MKFLLMPDSFKGSLSAQEICAIMQQEIAKVFPGATADTLPIADGGEGTTDAFLLALGGLRIDQTVAGPFFDAVQGFYGMCGETAIIETAACASLPMAGARKNPLVTTTYGVGELIREALNSRAKRIILGLGGSCTNDGGCGMAAALGVRFYNTQGEQFIPVGGTLGEIATIDVSGLDMRLKDTELTVMCDIDNPLCGHEGAAFVFAPQKGAKEADVQRLDQGLLHFASVLRRDVKMDVLHLAGGGAAGGMGAGAVALLGGVLRTGIDVVLDAISFTERLKTADCIFTGEGSVDAQSLRGKAVVGIARRAKAANVPVFVFAGGIGEGDALYECGITALIPTTRRPMPLQAAMDCAPESMRRAVCDTLRVLRAGQNMVL